MDHLSHKTHGVNMKNPVIVDAIRSPMARAKSDGALAELHPVDLL